MKVPKKHVYVLITLSTALVVINYGTRKVLTVHKHEAFQIMSGTTRKVPKKHVYVLITLSTALVVINYGTGERYLLYTNMKHFICQVQHAIGHSIFVHIRVAFG
jgi:hypothetical protein